MNHNNFVEFPPFYACTVSMQSVYVNVCMCMCVYVCECVYVCVCVCVCVYLCGYVPNCDMNTITARL